MKFPKFRDPLTTSPPGHSEESAYFLTSDVQSRKGKVVLPFKHARNRSTGSRPSAMEMAQAFNEITEGKEAETHNITSVTIPEPTSPTVSLPKGRGPLTQSQAEKRKSTYEKYSSIILPALLEEATPTTSPAGTVRVATEPLDCYRNKAGPSEKSVIAQESSSSNPADQDLPRDGEPNMMSDEARKVDSVLNQFESDVKLDDDQIADLLKPQPPPLQTTNDIQTISVEFLSIIGSAAIVVSGPQCIFYDSEILAVVHRVKSKASGLASTSVWCWLGKETQLGDREDKKLQELSRRYGTSAVGTFFNIMNWF